MSTSYGGIGHVSVTFPNKSGTEAAPCRLNSDGQIISCSNGEQFMGVVEHIRGDYCSVQVQGFVQVAVTGTVPNPGYVKLSANGSGGVAADSITGTGYWVVASGDADITIIL